MNLHLKTAESTEALGKAVAAVIAAAPVSPARTIMFEGTLGSGKTTLIRALVESLPGGDEAEVSSPSFNLYNLYPTTPETAHFDLYRLDGGQVDESLYDIFDEGEMLVLVEWAEYLPVHDWPEEWLRFRWKPSDTGRKLSITANGKESLLFLDALKDSVTRFNLEICAE